MLDSIYHKKRAFAVNMSRLPPRNVWMDVNPVYDAM